MVDLAEFDNMRTPYQQQRQRRGAGRGRDPNAEPLPQSSAQPLTRAELAYQRQMAIQSSQSVSTRNFGGQLTREDVQPVRAPERSAAATPVQSSAASRQPLPTAAFENLNLTANSASSSPQEQARRMRHEAVVQRASALLRNDATKLAEFRSRVSSFRTSSISATELIDAFFSLFDTSSTELGKLIKELADIYEEESKRSDLLRAWNDWRAINEDYPALPGPGGLLPGMSPTTVSTGGKRVLRLKSSTARSSRSAVGRSGALPTAPSNPFPPLSAAAGSSSRRGQTSATPWAAAPPPPPVSRPSPTPSRPSYTAPSSSRAPAAPTPRGTDAFPALPAAAKPNVLMAGKTRGTVRWNDNRGPAPTAWGSNPSSGNASPAEPDYDNDSSTGKKGKKNKGKQTLFHFG
jgi:ribosome assembly protein 4